LKEIGRRILRLVDEEKKALSLHTVEIDTTALRELLQPLLEVPKSKLKIQQLLKLGKIKCNSAKTSGLCTSESVQLGDFIPIKREN
jgi:hypothetical protein